MSDLEMRHLESFVVVAEEKNFSRAALRLHITQPPLSVRIKELEAILKVKLFDRTSKHVRLTAAGEIFRKRLQVAMHALDAAIEASRQIEQGVVGRLRVGYTGIARDLLLPRLLGKFGSLHPKVALDIVGPSATEDLELLLIKEEIDVALCFLPPPDKGLESRTLLITELTLVLPDRHPLARAKNLSLKDVAGEPFVSYPANRGFHLRAAIDAQCAQAGFRARVVKESRWSQSLLCLVAAGVGIAIVPKGRQASRIEGVTFRALHPPLLPLYQGIAWRKGDRSPIVASFLALADKTISRNRVHRASTE
jgi:DNA-binding transcriptional LysR family regulator